MNIITLQPSVAYSGTATITGSRYRGIGYYGGGSSATTLSYVANNQFRGTITVQATLEQTPTDSSDWFDIDSVTVSSGNSNLNQFSLKFGNFVWLRSVVSNFTAGAITSVTASYTLQPGIVGPTGTTGPTGPTGTTGPTGPTGPVNARIFDITSNGNSDFVIEGQTDPTIRLLRGFSYRFQINAPGHPFWIMVAPGAYNISNVFLNPSVINNGTAVGTITFTVPYNAPNTLYYVCQNHSSMNGVINIVDLGPTGPTGPTGPENFEIDGGNASTIYLAEIDIDGGNANG